MPSTSSDGAVPDGARPVKIVVCGPFGVGKTTYVGTVSEIRPMRTEERMTHAGALVDDLRGLEGKTTTTVAMDFGRLTLTDDIVLYLFGVPGQPRFAAMVRSLLDGALGALVLVDTRRVDQSFDALDLLEKTRLPYAVAVNHFDDARRYDDEELREALALKPETPLVVLDARRLESAKQGLITLVAHLLKRSPRLEPAR